MWGGLKRKTRYGDVFRRWSATKPVEEVRQALWKEPRPWFLLFSLHEHRHHLSDHHGSRILSWCTTATQLTENLMEKRRAYQYSQEVFRILSNHHHVGEYCILEYMRLCAVGKDLTAAYKTYQHLVLELSSAKRCPGGDHGTEKDGESHSLPGSSSRSSTITLLHLAWLARIATLSPSDDKAEDLAMGVVELYTQHLGPLPSCTDIPLSDTIEGKNSLERYKLWDTFSPVEQRNLQYLCCCLVSLVPRLQEGYFRTTLKSIPIHPKDAEMCLQNSGWPSLSHHHSFSFLEGGILIPRNADQPIYHENDSDLLSSLDAFPLLPRLKDSLLHPVWIQKLEAAALHCHNVQEVIRLLQWIQQRVGEEMQCAKKGVPLSRSSLSKEGPPVWRQLHDPSAVLFRKKVVEKGENSITPELYHYLIVALAPSRPTVALRTLQRMEEAKLRVLDITRTYLLVHVKDSPEVQAKLFADQLQEIDSRRKLDDDHGMNAHLEAYWKYDYVTFFHYQNKLSREDFFLYLMKSLGLRATQHLLLNYYYPSSSTSLVEEDVGRDVGSEEEGEKNQLQSDLVVLDADLRHAAYRFLSQTFGKDAVQTCLEGITSVMPQLDIGLIGSDIPHFENYALGSLSQTKREKEVHKEQQENYESPEQEEATIATDIASFGRLLAPYDRIYVLDSSFVETGEGFLKLGREESTSSGSFKRDFPSSTDAKKEKRTLGSLILIPYLCLRQLADSAAQINSFVSFDAALQQDIKEESNLALQRLHSLFYMICNSTRLGRPEEKTPINAPFRGLRARILHFTECFLSQMVPLSSLDSLALCDNHEDNYRMLLILSLVRTVAASDARVILCSDDEKLNQALQACSENENSASRRAISYTCAGSTTGNHAAVGQKHNRDAEKSVPPPPVLFHGKVEVLSTHRPTEVMEVVKKDVERGTQSDEVLDDNPILDMDIQRFQPVLHAPAWISPVPATQCIEQCDPPLHSNVGKRVCESTEEQQDAAGQKRKWPLASSSFDDSNEKKSIKQPQHEAKEIPWNAQSIPREATSDGHDCSASSHGALGVPSGETVSPWLHLLEEEQEESTSLGDEVKGHEEVECHGQIPSFVNKNGGENSLTLKMDAAMSSAEFPKENPWEASTDNRRENNEEEMLGKRFPPAGTLTTALLSSCTSSSPVVSDPMSLSSKNCLERITKSTAMKEETRPSRTQAGKVTEGVENRYQDALWELYSSVDDVVPVGAKIKDASYVDTVFHEFGVLEPFEKTEREIQKAAEMSPLTSTSLNDGDGGSGEAKKKARHWTSSLLMKEKIMNSGFSVRDRMRLARRLSNQSGGKVPFNLRYRVVEANISDPKNAHLIKLYQKGVERKRDEFRRKKQF